MSGFHPALVSMARDRRLKPTDIRVYILACQHLDFVQPRPLKLLVIAHDGNLSRSHVSESLTRLVRLQYLAREVRTSPNDPVAFRLNFSVPLPSRVRESGTAHEPELSSELS